MPRHERRVEAHGFARLRAAVALQRGDPHLGQHLQQALADRLGVGRARLRLVAHTGERFGARHRVERLEREVRADRAGAERYQERDVRYLPRFARLDHQPRMRSQSASSQVVMHRGQCEQRRNRRPLGTRFAVAEDENTASVAHG